MYTLYYDRRCGSATPHAMLEIIGVPYTLRRVDTKAGGNRTPQYLAISPLGQIPSLRLADGTVVTESAAVILALADRHPEAGLIPEPGSSARAIFLRWLAFLAVNVYGAVIRWDFPERYTADAAGAPALREGALAQLHDLWTKAEANLAPNPYLLGEGITALDIYMAMLRRWTIEEDWFAAHCPGLAAAAERTETHPGVAAAWETHLGE